MSRWWVFIWNIKWRWLPGFTEECLFIKRLQVGKFLLSRKEDLSKKSVKKVTFKIDLNVRIGESIKSSCIESFISKQLSCLKVSENIVNKSSSDSMMWNCPTFNSGWTLDIEACIVCQYLSRSFELHIWDVAAAVSLSDPEWQSVNQDGTSDKNEGCAVYLRVKILWKCENTAPLNEKSA